MSEAALAPNPHFERIRAWCDKAGITDPRLEFLCVVEEAGELALAMSESRSMSPHRILKVTPDIKDAIGDTVVTLVALHYLLTKNLPGAPLFEHLAGSMAPVQGLSTIPATLGSIAEGLRKPKKAHQAVSGCYMVYLQVLDITEGLKLSLVDDCLEPVLDIIESRLAGGKLVEGTFVKGADL